MAMMARMRSLAPWFILTVGGLFVLFMVLSDSRVLEFMGQQSQNVGSIDGEDVTYQEYSTLVERFRQNQEQSTGQPIDESQMDFLRDQVWDYLVTQKLLDKKVEEFGIVITDQEISDAILGPNPPAFLRQQFTDSTGNFNRELYEQAIRDPRNKEIILAVEDQVRMQLTQEKLQNFLFASITVSEQELRDRFVAQNIKMRSDFIQINPDNIPDSEITITDDEVKKYYDKKIDDYKIEPSRKLKYVLFRRQPSQSDSLGVKNNLEAIVSKLKSDTASFKSYVEIYSELPYSKDTVSITSLPYQVKEALASATKGDIIGPIATFEGYVIYKLNDKVKSKNEYVRASHILIRSTGNDAEDLKKANTIYNQLNSGADFASLARANSQDPGSAQNGGDLGWFGRGQMVKEFEDACYNGKINVVQKPVKTSYGYHIIKVTGRSNQDFVVEKIVNKIQISASTTDKLYQDATDFSYVANENGFEAEAKLLKYDVIETPPFKEDAQAIAGIGVSPPLVKWAFENGVNDVSEVYRVQAGYVVAMISDVIKAGFQEFEDVKTQVRNALLREKKFQKALSIASQIRTALGNNGDKNIAKSVYPQARVDSTAEYTISGTIAGIGREFAFTEYSYKADLNKWSQPIRGVLGVYLINVRYRTQFVPETFEVQKASIRQELLSIKKNRYFSSWLQELKKEADIVDNRYLFYRY